ncbi:reprolysin-like metallopeptidase [uncultured Croceitalea sp.]|uniref:zinc-dependent metalloprotease n=1 Tax=uncultured Croceitalea sp. TaxID=1798908 RepID=UPI0033059D84
MKAKLHFVFSITIFFSCFYGSAQNTYWTPITTTNKLIKVTTQTKGKRYRLAHGQLRNVLLQNGEKAKQVYLPDSEGAIEAFYFEETPVFHPDLSKKYPEIKSFTAWNRNRTKKARFSFAPEGMTMMLMDYDKNETSFVQKTANTADEYLVYSDHSSNQKTAFECKTEALAFGLHAGSRGLRRLADDQTLRRFRIAVSTTGEYTSFHGGTVAGALAGINATLTRVNEVFETDLGVTLELIPNNDLVVFTDAATDPYTGNLNGQTQSTLNSIIGAANYDVGHLFNKVDPGQDNGNAGFIGAVCNDAQKGSAFSSAEIPQGDLFDLDFVAHELGHQFGANHTWSFESEDTGVQAEPASGTTIMGYAGIVNGNDVAPNGDDYFHHYSILQVTDFLQTVSCAQTSVVSNTPPIITPLPDYVIPKGTAFVLEGSATDNDVGDVLTYTWEQIDNGIVTTSTFGPENVSGANFRSLRPTTNPSRYFPRLSRVVSGQLQQSNPQENEAWETVSDVERELNFALTVRDNSSEIGQTTSDIVKVDVVFAAGPFTVTSQTANEVYQAGSVQDITWDVANTNAPPINATAVDVYLSTDGGSSFPVLLAEDIPNTGLAQIQLSGDTTTSGRLMIKASNSVFFAVNASNFTIEASSMVLNFNKLDHEVCQPDAITIPFTYETFNGFAENAVFSANLPTGLNASFLPATASTNNTLVEVTLTGTAGVAVGSYPIDIIATAAGITTMTTIDLGVYDTNFTPLTLTFPEDGAINTAVNPELLWDADIDATTYDVEIASDALFTTVVETASTTFAQYKSSNLSTETTYYWRVRPKNLCGEGTFGTAFSFTTSPVNCKTFDTDQLPIEIISEDPSTITSKITFVEDLTLSDINVNLEVSHTFLEDLIIKLTSPAGTTVILTSKSCGSLNNINVVFDDDGGSLGCSGNPAIQGVVKPLGSLASFNGESILGEWLLTIEDTAATDGGSLDAFSLDVCIEGVFRPDEDEDGVFDDGDDLCLGTPKGVSVDTSGCPINNFPQNNFDIVIQSETCRQNDDGSVQVTATDTSITYTANLTGNGVDTSFDFTDDQAFENLIAGNYTLCITGTTGTVDYRETCFEIIITEPDELNVETLVTGQDNSLVLQMSGATLYNIELNGVLNQTTDNSFTIPLRSGVNTLKVSTALPCQGVYEEQLLVFVGPVAYPNPASDLVNVLLQGDSDEVSYQVFSVNGQLVLSGRGVLVANELQFNVSNLPSGVYVVKVGFEKIAQTFKLIKR